MFDCIPKIRGSLLQPRAVQRPVWELALFQAQGFQQFKRCFTAAQKNLFVAPLLPLVVCIGVRRDAATDAATSHLALYRHRSDGHIEGGRAARLQHTNGAAVNAPRAGLQLFDPVHGTHLGRAGDGAAREKCAKHIGEL